MDAIHRRPVGVSRTVSQTVHLVPNKMTILSDSISRASDKVAIWLNADDEAQFFVTKIIRRFGYPSLIGDRKETVLSNAFSIFHFN